MSYQSGGARYGIWGESPSLGNPFMDAIRIGGGLTDMANRGANTRYTEAQTANQPLIGEHYNQQNQLLAQQNQFYPQNQAVLLSNALNKQDETTRKTDRFGNPVYLANKTISGLPTGAKANYISQNADKVAQLVDTQLSNANNYDPNAQQQSPIQDMKYSILQPFLPQNGTNPTGNISPQNPMMLQNNASSSNSTNAIREGAQNDYTNKVYSVQDRNRIAAGGRAQVMAKPITEALQNIPADYSGATGKLKLLADQGTVAAGGTPSPSYLPYINFNKDLEGFQAEYAQVLGKRNTDHAMQEVRKIATPDMFFSNPDIVRATWAHTLDNLNKMEKINKLDPNKRMSEEEVNKIVNTPMPDGKAHGVYWMDGKPYTKNMLLELKSKGGK